MEPLTRGRVLTEAAFENLEDLWAAKRGLWHPTILPIARRPATDRFTESILEEGGALRRVPPSA